MNKKKLLLFILLCLIPSMVLADSGSEEFPLGMALFMEAFVSIHMTIFVLWPISNLFGGNNPTKLLGILFVGRIVILVLCDIFISPMIAIADFLAVFIGAFLIVPICSAITRKNPYGPSTKKTSKVVYYKEHTTTYSDERLKPNERKTVVRCSYCGRIAPLDYTTCDGCGAAFTEKDIIRDWR